MDSTHLTKYVLNRLNFYYVEEDLSGNHDVLKGKMFSSVHKAAKGPDTKYRMCNHSDGPNRKGK